MARTKALTREQVVDRAYVLACERGLTAVSIRVLATECGVALGTIYNYFPTKGDLLVSVVGRFWREELGSDMHEALEPGMDYVAFCRAFFADVAEALARFRRDWLPELAAAHGVSMADCPEAVHALDHMRAGLVRVLEADPRVDRARLTGELSSERIAALTLTTVLELTAGFGAAPSTPGAPRSQGDGATAAESLAPTGMHACGASATWTDGCAGAGDNPDRGAGVAADTRVDSCDDASAGSAPAGEEEGLAAFETFCRMLRLALYAAEGPTYCDAADEMPLTRVDNEKKSGS